MNFAAVAKNRCGWWTGSKVLVNFGLNASHVISTNTPKYEIP